MSNRPEDIHLSLTDNALDFLLSASEAASRAATRRNLKDAVVHAANGIEVLAKARLAREHWSLIFNDVNRVNRQKLEQGDFISVDPENTLTRLEQVAGFSIDGQYKPQLVELRNLRNRLTHFTAAVDEARAKSLVAKAMTFCVEFCEQQNMVTSDSEDKLGEIHTNLTDLKEFVDSRMASISASLEWHPTVLECPECWQEALAIDDGEIECKFCRYKTEPEDLADMLSEGRIWDCPECGKEQTFVFTLDDDSNGKWVCCSCGISGNRYDNCARCEQMTFATVPDDINFCEVCWEHLMHS